MKRSVVLAVVLAFASIWVLIGSAAAAVRLTAEVRVAALVMLPAVVVASLLGPVLRVANDAEAPAAG